MTGRRQACSGMPIRDGRWTYRHGMDEHTWCGRDQGRLQWRLALCLTTLRHELPARCHGSRSSRPRTWLHAAARQSPGVGAHTRAAPAHHGGTG
eukprot:364195-Chlamydomonas_euryale.AAC.3